jgi:NADPH:quinone reductase-like Zn-dependent oxidoreductase
MRAIVQDRYGPTNRLRVRDMPVPAVGADDVLVQVHAASVHPDVWHVVTGRPFVLRLMGSGLRRPKARIPGTDVSGVVVQVGRDVTRFSPGDEVFGESLRGYSWRNGGAFAEFVAAPEVGLEAKPPGVTFATAAAVPTTGFITLLNLPVNSLKPGTRVLVNGAAGGVGSFAVQIAKARGVHVTGVDHSTKLDLVRSLGADEVIDYTKEDFTQGPRQYDVIVDIPGNHPYSACRRALTPDGKYVLIGHDQYGQAGRGWLGSLPQFGGLMLRSLFASHLRRGGSPLPTKRQAMATLRELLEAGHLAPVIDRTFPLKEAAAAIDYLASGQARGRVVLTVQEDEATPPGSKSAPPGPR